nr:BFH_HP1_G0048790.mRNA.1.CDS.1 [Saccharomyces cerevisiae]
MSHLGAFYSPSSDAESWTKIHVRHLKDTKDMITLEELKRDTPLMMNKLLSKQTKIYPNLCTWILKPSTVC